MIVLVARSLKKLKSSLFLLVLASVVVIIVVLFAYCYITIIRGLSKEEEDAV